MGNPSVSNPRHENDPRPSPTGADSMKTEGVTQSPTTQRTRILSRPVLSRPFPVLTVMQSSRQWQPDP